MNKIFRLIVGLIFLLSALLKAIDNAAFADLMSSYGAQWFGFGAPVIIFVELILGVLLVFNIHARWLSLAASLFILVVSSVFLYGVTQKGITDCGCFGPLTWLNSFYSNHSIYGCNRNSGYVYVWLLHARGKMLAKATKTI